MAARAHGRGHRDGRKALRRGRGIVPRSIAGDFALGLLPDLARAYDLGGHADSALAVYARYVAESQFGRLASDALYLGPSLKRLGELYEQKGDRDNAAKAYARFIELWKNADAELQPHVAEARRRLEKLAPVEKAR